ncbi:TIR domain-containing protein [Pseudomonas fluorescens]|uniref:TIR domain-containing protein n=1 Tax=Pseudomonas fluorescens TaxID=294 RepID=UPI001CD275A7|nr:TIR domain-containing protein [Pseudomonas fluorescens]
MTINVYREVAVSLKIFLSYAKEDKDVALKYYDLLAHEGMRPWIDQKHILPGQNWEAEIDKAFQDAHVIILLLSKKSVDKRGFVQREANDAIERLRYKKPTDIYVIPLLLEPCDVPSNISGRLQYVDISTTGAWEQVKASLLLAAEQQSIELANGLDAGPFSIFSEVLQDYWEGAPGHDIKIGYPRFESATRHEAAKELSLFFGGRATRALIESRQKPWDQMPDYFPEPGSYMSLNGRWDDYGVVHATDQFLSLTYEVSWYGAGAAHPNSHYETYNFSMPERLQLLTLDDFFTNQDGAVQRISELCIAELCREHWRRFGEKPDDQQLEWFNSGAGAKASNFNTFAVDADHFTFLFSPYEVAAFACGRWSVDISFYDLLDYLKVDGPHLLAVQQNV